MQNAALTIVYFKPKSDNSYFFVYLLDGIFTVIPFLILIPFRHSEPYFIIILIVLCLLAFFMTHHYIKYFLFPLFGQRKEIIFNEHTVEVVSFDNKIRTYDKSIVRIVTGLDYDVKLNAFFCVQIEHQVIAKVPLKWTHPDYIDNFNEIFERYSVKKIVN